MMMISLMIVSAQTPPSHEEKGLVTVEHILGCVKSAVSILNKPMTITIFERKTAAQRDGAFEDSAFYAVSIFWSPQHSL